ncbi:MAG: hypothetical protein HYZ53_25655 [Planctomycetes bacterium]|nr:hypothetical protein [Planctomycetota bacterium]
MDTPVPSGEPVDEVTARAYAHPALGGRVVVRLSPETLAPGDDLEMELLGFARPEVSRRVAHRRRRALGFPGWALVHDPKNARHALAVVKEMKRLARIARSKPGHAHDGFEELARRLGRSVASFLPSFQEEVGRIFLEAGNRTYAAQAFGKARAAEKVHALRVDEEQRKQAFLDFALAGSLSIKSLSEYAKDLAEAHDAPAAYEHFRNLCVRRILGGMPPWGGMADDLRRLGQAAGLEPEAEDRRLLEEVLESPALSRAPREFWVRYRRPILGMAQGSTRIRGLLLNLFPVASGPDPQKQHGEWLDFLDECGAIESLVAPAAQVPSEAAPAGGAAAWFFRLLTHVRPGWREGDIPPQVSALLRRVAPRLKADATPLVLAVGRAWYRPIDLDLCDLALELEVPLADPPRGARIDLKRWAAAATDGPDRRRDPVHAAADARFATRLEAAVADQMGETAFEGAAQGKRGFLAAKRAWLERELLRMETLALRDLETALSAIAKRATAATFAECPGTLERLRRVDVAAALARTLRLGVVDEFGWPALEAVLAAPAAPGAPLPAGGKAARKTPALFGAFPFLALVLDGHVTVLGPAGTVCEHDLRLPKGASLQCLRFVGGQLLVAWRDSGYKTHGYWSDRPTESFESPSFYLGAHDLAEAAGVVLPDGGFTAGGRALHPGDTTLPETGSIFSDGTTCWTLEWDAGAHRLRELDPRTGEKGRVSLPRFFEEFALEGHALAVDRSCLLPAPPGLARSPLGLRDGLLGCRVRHRASGESEEDDSGVDETGSEVESIDGRRATGVPGSRSRVFGLLRWPGDDTPRVVTDRANAVSLQDPRAGATLAEIEIGAVDANYARGTPFGIPPFFWHYLAPRDEAGSRALRETSDEAARKLLDCARGTAAASDPEALRAAIRAVLPGLAHARLAEGILGVVLHAGALTARLEALAAERDPSRVDNKGMPDARQAASLRGKELARLLAALGKESPSWDTSNPTVQIAAFVRCVLEPPLVPRTDDDEGIDGWEVDEHLGASTWCWEHLPGRIAAVAFVAAAPGTAAADRALLLDLLEFWANTPMARHPSRFRCMELRFRSPEGGFLPGSEDWSCCARAHAGNVYFVRQGDRYGSEKGISSALEYAPNGVFAPPPGADLIDEMRPAATWDSPERLRRFIAAARERGPFPLSAEILDALSRRTGLTRPEAVLLWAGMPGVHSYVHDFLGKERRERLELKLKDAATARTTFDNLTPAVRAAVLGAAVPEEPERLWTPLGTGPEDESSPVARLAAEWNARVGRRAAVSEELLARVKQELDPACGASTVLGWLTAAPPPAALDEAGLCTAAMAVPFFFAALPVGDPLREGLPELLARARSRAAEPDLLVDEQTVYFFQEEDNQKAAQAFFAALPGTERHAEAEPDEPPARKKDGGLVVATAHPRAVYLLFRPAHVRDGEDPLLRFFPRLTGAQQCSVLSAVLLLRSPGFEAMLARIRKTPVPPGRFECDPVVAVPRLVKAVAARLKLTPDAAALYLQTLALVAPAAAEVRRWNDWTAERYLAAAAELTKRRLVVEAERSRAGRSHFLPGGWEALKAPDPPFESWKLPLYGLERDAGRILRPLKRFLPLRPLHELFAEAWRRVESGDAPSYERVS